MPSAKREEVRRSLSVLALGAVLLLAACGGSSPPQRASSGAGTAGPAPTLTATSATVTSQTAATATTVTSGVSTPPPCRASDLTLSFLGGQAATGHGLLGFELRNSGARTCRTYGYPGVLFLDHAGRALPTIPKHTTQDFFGAAPEVPLMLHPGESASFRLGVTHGAASTNGCTTAYGVQVIPPDDTATLRVSVANGAYECQMVTVSPLRPGATAYP